MNLLAFSVLSIQKKEDIRFLTPHWSVMNTEHLSVIVRENRAGAKDRGRPFTFIFSQYKSYLKRLGMVAFAEVDVRFSSRNHHSIILGPPAAKNNRDFGQLCVTVKHTSYDS